MGEVPALAQHTNSIFGELGFDATTIGGWRRDGVI
jgi:hypothetical protein